MKCVVIELLMALMCLRDQFCSCLRSLQCYCFLWSFLGLDAFHADAAGSVPLGWGFFFCCQPFLLSYDASSVNPSGSFPWVFLVLMLVLQQLHVSFWILQCMFWLKSYWFFWWWLTGYALCYVLFFLRYKIDSGYLAFVWQRKK